MATRLFLLLRMATFMLLASSLPSAKAQVSNCANCQAFMLKGCRTDVDNNGKYDDWTVANTQDEAECHALCELSPNCLWYAWGPNYDEPGIVFVFDLHKYPSISKIPSVLLLFYLPSYVKTSVLYLVVSRQECSSAVSTDTSLNCYKWPQWPKVAQC